MILEKNLTHNYFPLRQAVVVALAYATVVLHTQPQQKLSYPWWLDNFRLPGLCTYDKTYSDKTYESAL